MKLLISFCINVSKILSENTKSSSKIKILLYLLEILNIYKLVYVKSSNVYFILLPEKYLSQFLYP